MIKLKAVFLVALLTSVQALGLQATRNSSASLDDSLVELQWLVCEKSKQEFLAKWDEEWSKNDDYRLILRETKSLALEKKGIQIKYKKRPKGLESTVKVRYGIDQDVPFHWVENHDGRCEIDRYIAKESWGCKLKSKSHDMDISDDQLQFLMREKGIDPSKISELQSFTVPVEEYSAEFKDSEMNLEVIQIKGVDPIMEVSTRVEQSDADEIQTKFTKKLNSAGVQLCQKQEGKTGRIVQALSDE